ncbi:MAG: hypothetical protein WED34_11615 [Planctomycetales bacterium]
MREILHGLFVAFAAIALLAASIVTAFLGATVLSASTTPIHEIEAFLLFLISAVFAVAFLAIVLVDLAAHRIAAAIEELEEESQKAALIRSERQLATIVETINNLRVKRNP